MKLFNKGRLACLCGLLAMGAVASPPRQEFKLPHLAVSFELEKHASNADYDLNWADVPPVESKAFVPEMRCDLSKAYFALAQRPGFRHEPTTGDENPFPKLDDPGTLGVMPWPRLQGKWQNWQEGLYFDIVRIQERDTNGENLDFMVLKVYSMCTNELLAESSVLIKNPQMNRALTIPMLSYALRMSGEQMSFKVIDFKDVPQTDVNEIELRYVDPMTKEPKRSVVRIFRFL